jgi:hypothetical protein
MANYIHTLRAAVDTLRAQQLATHAAIQDFRVHLAGPKFGPQADGELADYIRLADVRRWLAAIAAEVG